MRHTTFASFWPFYLREHRLPATRRWHLVGTSAGLMVAAASVVLGRPKLLPLAIACGYAPAWMAHFCIERNRPATFKQPLYSFAADFKMFAYFCTGRLDVEIARITAAASTEKTDDGAAEAAPPVT